MSVFPSPLAAALAGAGLGCFALGAAWVPDTGFKLIGVSLFALALTATPARADQFVEAADNARIDCVLSRGELTRIALIDDGVRSASIVAATDLLCYGLTPWEFRPFVEEHPKVAWALLEALARRIRESQASDS